MLEKPAIPDEQILTCLRNEFGLRVAQITFLPLGADLNTAVYRAVMGDGATYFVKLRLGDFDEVAVTLPKYLSDQGIAQIIAPLATQTGQLWADAGAFKLILYPFVAGHDGYEVMLSERQWRDFGAALRRIHSAEYPPDLLRRIPREAYSPFWRDRLKRSLQHIDAVYTDPVAVKLAAFVKTKQGELVNLIDRADKLAQTLQTHPPAEVLCHSDAHAGNIFIDASDKLYIVDWDNPILAPKERDLLFIGGAQGFRGTTAQEEEKLFYRGYGPTQIDADALLYFRTERIIVDIAIYCEQILFTTEGGEDREQSLLYLKSNFLPNGTIEAACYSDELSK